MDITKISSIIRSQFPNFAIPDYTQFIKFLQLYYQFVETNDFRSLKNFKDIDNSIDLFVEHIKSDLGFNVPPVTTKDDKFLLKHIKEFYSTKGTEESFKILFRHLFGSEITITYPKDVILKVSDGKWKQEVSVLINGAPGFDPFELSGSTVTINVKDTYIENYTPITYIKKSFYVGVDRVRLIDTNLYEIFLQQFYYDDLNFSSYIEYDSVEHLILPTIGHSTTRTSDSYPLKIIKRGTKFKVGQLFNLNTVEGNGAIIKISNVDAYGAILNAEIVSFGSGYIDDFYTTIVSTLSKSVELDPSKLYDYTAGFVEVGHITISNYFFDYSAPDYSGEVVGSFFNDNTVIPGYNVEDIYTAIIETRLGIIRKYPGEYISTDGFLSENFVLQDNHFYQIYSYVINTTENIDKYKDIIKQLLHPAGYIVFGNLSLYNEFDLSATIETTANLLRQFFEEHLTISETHSSSIDKIITETNDIITSDDSFISQFNKSILDYVVLDTDTNTFHFEKVLSDTQILLDSNSFNVGKSLTDSQPLIDSNSHNVGKALDDTQTLTDSNSFTVNKSLTDNQSLEDFNSTNIDKSLTDNQSLTDSNSSLVDKSLTDNQSLTDSGSIDLYNALLSYFSENYSINYSEGFLNITTF